MTTHAQKIEWLQRELNGLSATGRDREIDHTFQVLRAILSDLEAQQWRPIETAPKDGTEILAYFGPRTGVKSVVWEESVSGNETWCVDDDKHGPYSLRGYNDPYPSVWKPLPAPPEAGETK